MEVSTRWQGLALRQPEHAEQYEYPEAEAQAQRDEQTSAGNELGGRVALCLLLGLVLQVAWLIALAYLFHRLVLGTWFP